MVILLYKLSPNAIQSTPSLTHYNWSAPPPISRLLGTQDLESNCVFTKITLNCYMSHLSLKTLKKGVSWESVSLEKLPTNQAPHAIWGPCTMPTPAKGYPGEAWTTTKPCAFGKNVTTMREINTRPCKARLGRPWKAASHHPAELAESRGHSLHCRLETQPFICWPKKGGPHLVQILS